MCSLPDVRGHAQPRACRAVTRVALLVVASLLGPLGALADAGTPGPPDAPTLYARIGGAPVIDTIARELVESAAANPDTRRSFEGVTLSRTSAHIAVMLCQLTGGGCVREGDTMREIHAGLGIDQREFYAMVESLRSILTRHGIGVRERNELLAILAPMKRDVVEK